MKKPSAPIGNTALLKKQCAQAFQEAYDRLNPDQKLAVDTIEGPVLVVAGPGTGKTQV
ncbi:UvrD-helicase domain-containing protein, partial [Candidatus Woesebacteria bacterium]|nr:UvrD-helicase domain-containing protein [Candidatus Woesebacteria bacterium]